MRRRLLREEQGFTLSEMMVTIMIMIVVMFALYNIFDMSIRVFSFGNNKVEAVEQARLGLEKMERELRGAYKVNRTASPAQNHLFFNTASPASALGVPPASAGQITFGNEFNGNEKIECGSPCEYITYKLTNASGGACTVAPPCTLRRVNTANSSNLGDPVVENVALNGLTFTFYKSDGGTPANEGEVGKVLVNLNVIVDPGSPNAGTQELTTEIDLRNRTS